MTEVEWLDAKGQAQGMLLFLKELRLEWEEAGRRKFRLVACGSSRVIGDALPDGHLQEAVRVGERFADGQATKDESYAARNAVRGMAKASGPFADRAPEVRVALLLATAATEHWAFTPTILMTAAGVLLEDGVATGKGERRLCDLIRCVFGNPFRPVTVPPTWLTFDVIALATGIYQEHAFDQLPVLADALEDAGCDHADILNHLRSDGPHALGCWPLDVVLGKS